MEEKIHTPEEEINSSIPTEELSEEITPELPTEEVPEENEIEKLKKEIEEQNDKYLRLAAEFDNFRRRTIKEKAELILNGSTRTITAILPVLDDMERAVENAKKTEDIQAITEGLELIQQKFLKVLEQEGLEKIETTEATFDTDFHEAIVMTPIEEEEKKGKVVDCIQTGYKLNNKVIRHAKVVVGQ